MTTSVSAAGGSEGSSGGPTRRAVFIDIDDTMYPRSAPIHDMVHNNILSYCVRVFGFSPETVKEQVTALFKAYGITLRGLKATLPNVDVDDFLAFCHGTIDIEGILAPDAVLVDIVTRIKATGATVWAATNADLTHATRVTTRLGVRPVLDGVMFVNASLPDFACKPQQAYFDEAARRAGAEGDSCQRILVDDSPSNCEGARKIGWTSILCKEDASVIGKGVDGCADMTIRSLADLPEVWPQLFEPVEGSTATQAKREDSLEDLATLLVKQLRSSTFVDDMSAKAKSDSK